MLVKSGLQGGRKLLVKIAVIIEISTATGAIFSLEFFWILQVIFVECNGGVVLERARDTVRRKVLCSRACCEGLRHA